ncbi:putative cytochrome P450 [Russula aff. rugulosa BPL654]|nr:putative cytochrome P450 [Russula aff. rugulosa BPL654]
MKVIRIYASPHIFLTPQWATVPTMNIYSLLPSLQQGVLTTAAGLLLYALVRVIYNLYFHPLSRFPGPRGAACTRWWLAYMELGRGISLTTVRAELHKKYGDIIRIAPNELHFAKPTAYDEIYNLQNKWDKDYEYYRAFDMDESSFTQPSYPIWKQRRAAIPICFLKDQFQRYSTLFGNKEQNADGKSSDLYLGFQCFAADTITNFLFATCFDQLSFPDFQGDIIKAIDIGLPIFTLAKFSVLVIWMVRYFPPSILVLLAPSLKGIVIFKTAVIAQVKSIMKNPKLLDDAPHRVIYTELLNPEAIKGLPSPTALQLSHEGQVLFAAGSHTVGTTLMAGFYYLLRSPEAKQRLVDEVRTAWPVLDQAPHYEDLEKLPFLTAVIKETLRMAISTPAGLPRVVPPSGAVISGVHVPGGAIVSQSAFYVLFSEEIFAQPHDFLPDRWLQPESKALEGWLVPFSKGPRRCLGINLAYYELYLTFAYLFRRFDVREDPAKPADLSWSEHFLPLFEGQHLHAYCIPLSE